MKNISIVIIVLFLIFSCNNDFEAINTNPNSPTEIQASLLLRQVIYDYGEELSYEGFVAGNLLGQHFTMVDFNLFDRHNLTQAQLGGNPWPTLYTNLRDNELILNQSRSKVSEAIYEGPALILKAYMTAALTDIYGDVPYSEALSASDGIVSPAYDTQETIYTSENGILDNLDRAIEIIKSYEGVHMLEGDLLFNGDLDAWTTFARSLKFKSLIRISDRLEVGTALQDLYNTQDFILENEQNATFDFTDGRPNSFRMQQLRDGDFNLFVLSETMAEILSDLQDPRQEVLFRPIGNDSSGKEYVGLLNGPDASQTSISVSDYSLTGKIFREQTGLLDANFLCAWELHFLLAEAAEKGLILADAQDHYEKGVALAFEYWHTFLPEEYLKSGSAAYGLDGANKIEQIITQKWIANSINGYEGWIEYRRTGFPKLKTIASSLNEDLIPSRMPYPTDEAALNQLNYEAAIQNNNNSINAQVWWDLN